jgi:hypothetical protein
MEQGVSDDSCGIHLSGWEALAPAQRKTLTSTLERRAHAARSRAIGKALLGAMGGLFGRAARALASAAAPASARR